MDYLKKSTLIFIFILSFSNVFSQQTSIRTIESTILVNKAFSNNARTNVKGSPYLNDVYMPATIKPLNKTYLVRYNAVDDEMEVQQNSKVLILNKNVKDYVISFNNTGQSIKVFEDFESKKNGFYTVVKETANVSLYRKDRKVYVKGKKAQHSSLNDSPNEFRDSDSKYFIRIASQDEAVKNIPSSKKKFIALFPEENQEEVKTILKKNKIKLSKEDDLKKLVVLLNDVVK